jgi:hypothetical protein
LDSLSEYYPCATATEPACRSSAVPLAPSEVCSPLAFPRRAEPHTPGASQHAGYVAPSGFLTLSTPCSPHDLPGLFHPGSTRGVRPSRPSSPNDAVRPLERRVPHGVPRSASAELTLAPPGIEHIARSTNRELWGLASGPTSIASSSFAPLRGFLPSASAQPVTCRTISPLALGRRDLRADPVAGAPGCLCGERSRSLSRPTQPPWGFLPLGPSHRWGAPQPGLLIPLGDRQPFRTVRISSSSAVTLPTGVDELTSR